MVLPLVPVMPITGMARPHLDDGNLVFLREAEEGLGHTHVVVEVALSGQHVILLRKYCLDQFLRGGLAVGAGDADDGDFETAAVFAGQVLERLQAVVDLDELRVEG